MNQAKDLKDCQEIDCDGEMVEKGETGRESHYSNSDGVSGIIPEKIYQCRKCKNIEILLDY